MLCTEYGNGSNSVPLGQDIFHGYRDIALFPARSKRKKGPRGFPCGPFSVFGILRLLSTIRAAAPDKKGKIVKKVHPNREEISHNAGFFNRHHLPCQGGAKSANHAVWQPKRCLTPDLFDDNDFPKRQVAAYSENGMKMA